MDNGVHLKKGAILVFVILLFLVGCTPNNGSKPASGKDSVPITKTKPDQMTDFKLALASKNVGHLIFYVGIKNGIYKKNNLNLSMLSVQGGVLALRGLQSGEFQVAVSLPEPVITGVAEGGNFKLIGTVEEKSLYTIYVTKDINKAADLKGKIAAGNVPGNGTDFQLRYWLKKNGIEPDKDIRLINAGDVTSRMNALLVGQAAVTILAPPVDLKADEAGLKRLAYMSDELKNYNHEMLVSTNDIIKNKPEILYAFMAANAESIKYIKDKANREELIKICMDELGLSKENADKSIDFVLPTIPDGGKVNAENIKWLIDTVKETGAMTKTVSVDQVVNESFYKK